jgi:hypothetical protein
MTPDTKKAVLVYLEFNLIKFVEKIEQHIDNDAVGALYAEAYLMLNDMDRTMQSAININDQSAQPKTNS